MCHFGFKVKGQQEKNNNLHIFVIILVISSGIMQINAIIYWLKWVNVPYIHKQMQSLVLGPMEEVLLCRVPELAGLYLKNVLYNFHKNCLLLSLHQVVQINIVWLLCLCFWNKYRLHTTIALGRPAGGSVRYKIIQDIR